jgi:hypothetical protein
MSSFVARNLLALKDPSDRTCRAATISLATGEPAGVWRRESVDMRKLTFTKTRPAELSARPQPASIARWQVLIERIQKTR